MVRRRLTIVCLGALLAALGVLAAACGGTSKVTVTQTVTTSAAGNAQARFGAGLQAFRTCLQQHGVTLPQFTPRARTGTTPTTTTRGRGGGFFGRQSQTPAQQKAYQACQSKLPQGGFGFRGRNGNNPPPGGGFNNSNFTKYTNCLKKHGVTFGKSSSSSAFQKAQAACHSLLPSRPTAPTLKPATTTVATS